ncbi:hypothetical protein B0189_09940, partial [Moraxella cuniculi]
NFDKNKVQQEITLQQQVTFAFGQNAPKAVAEISDYAITKILNNPNLSTDEKLAETKKWAEGGIYRIALHTATAALATGTIEGAVSAGTTAYTIPKIDEYLTKQGFDETTRQTALLALSAGIGATIGGDTASTVNNVGQTRWNYLYHESALRNKQLTKKQKRSYSST